MYSLRIVLLSIHSGGVCRYRLRDFLPLQEQFLIFTHARLGCGTNDDGLEIISSTSM